MEPWAVVAIIVTALFSAGSLVVAIVANRHAAQSATSAEESSTEAKRANELVQLQADRSVETWIVEWLVIWNSDTGEIVMTHQGKDPAHSTFAIVRGGDDGVSFNEFGTVDRGGVIRVPQPEFVKTRRLENPRRRDEVTANSKIGVFDVYVAYSREIALALHWQTGLGKPEQASLVLEIS